MKEKIINKKYVLKLFIVKNVINTSIIKKSDIIQIYLVILINTLYDINRVN